MSMSGGLCAPNVPDRVCFVKSCIWSLEVWRCVRFRLGCTRVGVIETQRAYIYGRRDCCAIIITDLAPCLRRPPSVWSVSGSVRMTKTPRRANYVHEVTRLANVPNTCLCECPFCRRRSHIQLPTRAASLTYWMMMMMMLHLISDETIATST